MNGFLDELILNKKRFLKGLGISIAIGAITALVIIFITTNQDTWTSLSSVNKKSLFLPLLLMVLAAVIDAFRIKMTVEAVNEKISFTEALKVYYISNFAGGITPFFSGTLPTQIYLFNKDIKNNMTLGKATMVATIMPLIKTMVFAIFTPIIFFNFKKTMTNYTVFSTILINGAILISVLLLFLFILAAKYPEKMLGIISKIQHLPCIAKFSRKKQISRLFDTVTLEIKEFHKSFFLLKGNWIKLLLSAFFTIIFWGIFFLVAPLLLRGFGIDFNFSHVLAMQVIFYFILPFMPTPGGSGTAEAGFASLFSFFVPVHLLGLFVGTWRFIAFYFNLCIGAIILLVDIKRVKNKKRQQQEVDIK